MHIKGIALNSGMLYTSGRGFVSLVYRKEPYKKRCRDKGFMKYTDPEAHEIISKLPPVLLSSARGDFLRSHTLKFARTLKANGAKPLLIYYPDRKDLTHAFVSLRPSLPESRKALTKIYRWIKSR